MKTNKIITLLITALMVSVVSQPVKAQQPDSVGGAITVTEKVQEILLDLPDNISVTLEKTIDKLSIKSATGLKADGGVAITQNKDNIVVKLHSATGPGLLGGSRKIAKATIAVPAGYNVRIAGQNFVLSGEVSAKNLKLDGKWISVHAFKAGATGAITVIAEKSDIKMTVAKAQKIDISGSGISGTIMAPVATQVVAPEQTLLKIVRVGS